MAITFKPIFSRVELWNIYNWPMLNLSFRNGDQFSYQLGLL